MERLNVDVSHIAETKAFLTKALTIKKQQQDYLSFYGVTKVPEKYHKDLELLYFNNTIDLVRLIDEYFLIQVTNGIEFSELYYNAAKADIENLIETYILLQVNKNKGNVINVPVGLYNYISTTITMYNKHFIPNLHVSFNQLIKILNEINHEIVKHLFIYIKETNSYVAVESLHYDVTLSIKDVIPIFNIKENKTNVVMILPLVYVKDPS